MPNLSYDFASSGTGAALATDTDGTLAANSDARVATQKATKTYVDASVIGLLDLKGATDCSANPNYPAASKGDYYVVTVAGKIGGASGASVDAGDVYFASADNAGGTEAGVGASWAHLEHNLIAATIAPLIDGAAAVGTGTRYAREDHVHPTDTTRAALASPTFTGVPTAPTASPGTNTTQVATTAYADAIAALKANLASPTFTGTVTIPTLAVTNKPTVGGITPPAAPKFPTTAAEAAALMAAGTGTTAIVAADVYEVWEVCGTRFRAMIDPTNKSLTPGTGIDVFGSAGNYGPGLLPFTGCPARCIDHGAGNANSKFTAAANTVMNVADETTASDLFFYATFATADTNSNYTTWSKYQSASILMDFGVTQAGEQQIYINDGTHSVFPTTSGKALRDSRVHFLSWGFDWGSASNELVMCNDAGTPTKSTKGTVTTVSNTGKFTSGGTDASTAPPGFAVDYGLALMGAHLDAVSHQAIQQALGVTGAI